jgi:chaperonin GroES
MLDRIIAKAIPLKDRTESGILLGDRQLTEPEFYRVLEVGPGGKVNGHERPMEVQVGDKILCTSYGPLKIKVNNENLVVIRQLDVVAIVEETDEEKNSCPSRAERKNDWWKHVDITPVAVGAD